MELWINKKLIKEWEVSAEEYTNYLTSIELPNQAFQIDIVYPNDDDNPELTGRTLFIESITRDDEQGVKHLFLVSPSKGFVMIKPEEIVLSTEDREIIRIE